MYKRQHTHTHTHTIPPFPFRRGRTLLENVFVQANLSAEVEVNEERLGSPASYSYYSAADNSSRSGTPG